MGCVVVEGWSGQAVGRLSATVDRVVCRPVEVVSGSAVYDPAMRLFGPTPIAAARRRDFQLASVIGAVLTLRPAWTASAITDGSIAGCDRRSASTFNSRGTEMASHIWSRDSHSSECICGTELEAALMAPAAASQSPIDVTAVGVKPLASVIAAATAVHPNSSAAGIDSPHSALEMVSPSAPAASSAL